MQIDQWDFPDDLYYNDKHSWARVQGDIVTAGVNEFLLFLSGEITLITLPKVGEKFEFGERIGTLEAGVGCCGGGGGWLGSYFAPVSGEIVEVNGELENEPSQINKSPYDRGWIVKMKMSDPTEPGRLMKNPGDVREFIFSEIEKVANK